MEVYNILAQIPGADEALRSASAQGWTATIVCATFFAMVLALVWLIKRMFTDKDKLADRLTTVEDFQKSKMVDLHVTTAKACDRATAACELNSQALEKNSIAIDKLTLALFSRPCLLPEKNHQG